MTDHKPITIHDDWRWNTIVIQWHRRTNDGTQYATPARPHPERPVTFPGDWAAPSDPDIIPENPTGLAIDYRDARDLLEALMAHLGLPNALQAAQQTIETLEMEQAGVLADLAAAEARARVAEANAEKWQAVAEARQAHLAREAETVDVERRHQGRRP